MEDIMLGVLMIALFAFGYFLVCRYDRVMKKEYVNNYCEKDSEKKRFIFLKGVHSKEDIEDAVNRYSEDKDSGIVVVNFDDNSKFWD